MELSVKVDSRERNTEILEELGKLGVAVSVHTMRVGDYAVSDKVCIERKTVADFESSLINGRLFEQLERLREAYPSPLLLVEGSANEFRLARNAIIGAIAYVYIDKGMQLVLSEGPKETAALIAAIARHEQHKNKREPALKGGVKAYTDSDYQEYVVGNLPGVGPKLARGLLLHFRSIHGVANASVDELMRVKKIGRKKSERIHAVLNANYKPESQ